MLTTLQAVILGLLQGLSEFLPISSSAHLTLVPWLLGWPDPGLAFDVALHAGTLVAVLWYFRAEWLALIRAAVSIARERRITTVEQRRVVFLIVATVPAALAGLALEKIAESAFRNPALIAVAMIVMGVVLWAVDRFSRRDRHLDGMRWLDALVLGLAQVLALVPGFSRSGSTITAGRLLGYDRESAAVFSFLMSMPIIAAAAILKLPDLVRDGVTLPVVAGMVAAALSGWLAISLLIRYLSRHSYAAFALYRLIFGVAVLAIYFLARG